MARMHANTRDCRGFTLVELMIVTAIVGIVAAVAVPGLLHARMSGNEASAIGSLRAINSGQVTYSATCAHGGYAVDLADLVRAPVGSSQGFVSPDLQSNGVVKSGYVVALAADASTSVIAISSPAATCNASTGQPMSSYFASANPLNPGTTGSRYFATDIRGTIFFSTAGTVSNPLSGANPIVQ